MTDTKLSVTLTGDNSGLQQALDKSTEGITHFGGEIMKLALGFGTVAGAASMLAEKIVEIGKSIIEFIPNSIESTGLLTEQFKQLTITAGMSVGEFNQYSAAIELSGGKTEDLGAIVQGMERGIKQHSQSLIDNGIAANKAALDHMTLGEYISKVVTVMNTYGTATEKDQLLMAAFGRGGMQFAAQLVEINKNLKEGAEITDRYSVVTAKLVEQETQLAEAKGRLALAEKGLKAAVTEAAIEHDIALTNFKARELEGIFVTTQAELARKKLDKAIRDGLIEVTGVYRAEKVMGDNYHGKFIEDRAEEQAALDRLTASWKRYADETKNSMDAGARIGTGGGTAPSTGKFIAPEETAAKKAAAKEAEAAAEKAREETRRAYNALVDEGTQLERKGLEINLATTLEGKKQEALAKARNDYADTMAKIKTTRGTSTDSDVNMQANIDEGAAANVRRLAEQKAQQDFDAGTLAEQKKVQGEVLAGTLEHQKALLGIDLERINKQRSLGQIGGAEAAAQAQAIEDRIYAIELKALDEQTKVDGLSRAELQKILNEKQALTDAYDKRKLTNSFTADSEWAKEAKKMQDQVENDTARSLTRVITEHQKAGEALKSAWTSVSTSVINDLIQMGVHHMLLAAIQKTAATAGVAANTTAAASTVATDATQTSAAEVSMASKIYSWYAAMGPWGVAAAAATIAAVIAAIGQIGKVTAHATGGMINGPTLALMGEAGPEMVAPKEDFLSVTRSLVASGASMYGSIVASQARANGYHAANYMPSSSQMAEHPGGGQTFAFNGNIFASSLDGQRAIQQMVNNATAGLGRSQG